MDRPVIDIPGYYFDKEKKKYFKIQRGSPASVAYSAQDVKRRKTREEKSDEAQLAIDRQKGRIRRSKGLTESLAGGILAREQGKGALQSTEVYARGLLAQGHLPLANVRDPLFIVEYRPDLGPSRLTVGIANDAGMISLRANAEEVISSSDTSLNICRDVPLNEVSHYHLPTLRLPPQAYPTSLSLHQPTGQCAITCHVSEYNNGIMILSQPESPTEGGGMMAGPGTSRGTEVSIYTSAPGHPDSNHLFAFGTSHGIMRTDRRDLSTHWITPKPSEVDRPLTDIFALESPADNPWILLAGGRKGILYMEDDRIPEAHHYTEPITHQSSITHIKQLDPHRVLVAGLNSSLCQYDFRFCKKAIHQPPPPSGRKYPKSSTNSTPTTPILQYPDYFNTATIQIGLDVDLETGVVAAAQEWDEFHAPVQLFSLHGGHTLNSPELLKSLPPGENRNNARVKTVRFVKDGENRLKSLYVSHGASIKRFTWTGRGV